MIRKNEFKQLDLQVKTEMTNAIEKAKSQSKNNDFLLFLSNAQYVEYLKDCKQIPYVVDYRHDHRHDSFRLNILMEYLNSNYSFSTENTADYFLTVTFELMIYTHMWESKPFLKQLHRLAQLANGLDYSWDVKVPDFPKYKFIVKIREMFESKKLGLGELIKSSFNSSLRNAFAHSEYNFGLGSPVINLTNYKGKAEYEIKKITFDEWTLRFCKSFLIAYYFQNLIFTERKSLINMKNYEVKLKDNDGNSKKGQLIYDSKKDAFSAKIIE